MNRDQVAGGNKALNSPFLGWLCSLSNKPESRAKIWGLHFFQEATFLPKSGVNGKLKFCGHAQSVQGYLNYTKPSPYSTLGLCHKGHLPSQPFLQTSLMSEANPYQCYTLRFYKISLNGGHGELFANWSQLGRAQEGNYRFFYLWEMNLSVSEPSVLIYKTIFP